MKCRHLGRGCHPFLWWQGGTSQNHGSVMGLFPIGSLPLEILREKFHWSIFWRKGPKCQVIWAWVTKQNPPTFASQDIQTESSFTKHWLAKPLRDEVRVCSCRGLQICSRKLHQKVKIKTETPFSALLGWLNLGVVIANGVFSLI